MRLTALSAALLMIAAMLAGCTPGHRAEQGTLAGAVAGGIIGSQVGKGSGRIAGAMAGAFLGGVVGHEIGRHLDEADRRAAMEAEYRALEYGQTGNPTPWRNPDSGHYGRVVPGKPYKEAQRHCRTYTHTIYVDGEPQTMSGTACRRQDGTWKKVS